MSPGLGGIDTPALVSQNGRGLRRRHKSQACGAAAARWRSTGGRTPRRTPPGGSLVAFRSRPCYKSPPGSGGGSGGRGMTAKLTFQVLEGVDKGRVFRELPTPITIGREEGNILRLNDERVSRYHA